MSRSIKMSALIAPLALLAACGGEADPELTEDGLDPGLEGALGDQIMVDPDLAGQNDASAGLTTGTRSGTLPASARSPEAIAKARAEALKMLGGPGALQKAPDARDVTGTSEEPEVLTAAARAAAAPGGDGNCADKADYTMQWAAKLPKTFPVYPRGAVQEAAGTDDGSCSLRVVSYITAVPRDEVIDFYYSRAAKAGFKTQRVRDGEDDVLGGTKGQASYVVYARKMPNGGTEVDLVTSG